MKIATYLISAMLTFSLAPQGKHAEQITVSLSNPKESGHLTINHHKGSIRVTGYHGSAIIVKASMRYGAAVEPLNLGAVEGNNHVIINATPRHRTIDLEIEVPYRFSLRLKNDDSGNIIAEGLTGDIEVSNINGDISLKDISGSAVLDTVDGDMTVQFKDIPPGMPMAFSSVEGNIDITFPEDVNALAKVRADSGYIVNDFGRDAQARQEQTVRSAANTNHRGQWSYDKMNDGGPEILLRSFLGNIHIRRQQSN